MRKTAILLLLGSAFILNLNAQFSIGVTGGVNISRTRIINVDHIDPESVLYYFVGVTPGYQINDKLSFITDIQLSQKGFQAFDTLSDIAYKWKLSYLDLMPQIEYRFHNNISAGFGFNLGFKIAEETKNGNEDWIKNEVFQYTKAIDLGLVASLKYHIDNFHLLSRVNFGLADISDITFTDVNGQSLGDNKIRSMNFQLGVGYTFN